MAKKRKRYPQSRREKAIRYKIAHTQARIRENEAEKAKIEQQITAINAINAIRAADRQRQIDDADFRNRYHQLRLRYQN